MFKIAVNVISAVLLSVVTVPIFRPLRGGVNPGRPRAAWDARRKHGMCPVSSELSVVSCQYAFACVCVVRVKGGASWGLSL